MNKQRGFAPIAVVVLVVLALVVVGGSVYVLRQRTPAPVETPAGNPPNENPAPTSTEPTPTSGVVTLDLSSAYAQRYKTLLSATLKKPADFNGHYVVATVGCGSGCFGYAVIDKNTGKVYEMPAINDIGQFRGDIGQAYSLNSNLIKVIVENGSKLNTYAFNGTGFVLVTQTSSGGALATVNWKTYTGSNYSFEYPASWVLEETDSRNHTSVAVSHLRPGRVPQPIDCGGFVKAPDEIVVSVSVTFQSHDNEISPPSGLKTELIGGKTVETRRNIPGMCGSTDLIKWDGHNGFVGEFDIEPSNTNLVSEYTRIIESFRFNQ